MGGGGDLVEETGEGAGKGGYPMTGGNMCWGTPSEGVNSHGSHQEGGGRGEGGEAGRASNHSQVG